MRGFWKSGLTPAIGLGVSPETPVVPPPRRWFFRVSGCIVSLLAGSAVANVYPSGLQTDTSNFAATCGTAQLTYVLNEDADGDGVRPGVKVEVLNGAAPVRTVTIARQARGMHRFEWDGRKDDGAPAQNGNYTIRITAADYGYSVWTRINPDQPSNNFYFPMGVAVNVSPDSPHYGKIYISEALGGLTGGTGGRTTQDGIYVLKADNTELGYFSGGRTWTGSLAPWKSAIGPDGHLYVADLSNDLAFEFSDDLSTVTQLIDSTNKTLGPDGAVGGLPNNDDQFVGSVWVEGTREAGNRKLYLVNTNQYDTQRKGVIVYNLGAGNTAVSGDTGTQLIPPGAYDGFYPTDVSRDPAGNWYRNAFRSKTGEASPLKRLQDGAPPLTTVLWSVPNTFTGAYGLGAFQSADKKWISYADNYTGRVFLFDQANGSLVASITVPGANTSFRLRDVAFDAVGNLYTVDNFSERLYVMSPPDGANTSSTVSAAFSLNKTDPPPQVITGQPQSTAFCIGGSAVLSVTTVAGGHTYQWRKNEADLADDGVNVIGATTSQLTLNNVQAIDNGAAITVLVCNGGVEISDPAVLSVGVTIAQAPVPRSICANDFADFTAAATGKGTLHYQWQKDAAGDPVSFQDIPGETGTILTLTGVPASENGSRYRVNVTDDCGTVASAAADLEVKTGPIIDNVYFDKLNTPQGTEDVIFYVSARGTGILHYQWHRTQNGVTTDIGGDAANWVEPLVTCEDDNTDFTVTVTDDCGSSTSIGDTGTARLTVAQTAEICNNAMDDDCDGAVDCADSECLSTTACCNVPFADAEGNGAYGFQHGDGDVDQNDYAYLQRCFTGPSATLSAESGFEYCHCLDRRDLSNAQQGDNRISVEDLEPFIKCVTGPAVPWISNPDCP